jgi:hypothetical protein
MASDDISSGDLGRRHLRPPLPQFSSAYPKPIYNSHLVFITNALKQSQTITAASKKKLNSLYLDVNERPAGLLPV